MSAEGQSIDFNTAIVMCGGVGSRDLPNTLFRPNTLAVIGGGETTVAETNAFEQLTVDLGRAGIKNMVVTVPGLFDIAPGQNLTAMQISNWFYGIPALQTELARQGKDAETVAKAGPHKHGVEHLIFASQPLGAYGTGPGAEVSLNAAMDPANWRQVEDDLLEQPVEPVDGICIVNGDGFNYRSDGGSDLADLFEFVNRAGAEGGFVYTQKGRPTNPNEQIKGGVVQYSYDGRFEMFLENPLVCEIPDDGRDVIDYNAGIYAFRASSLLAPLRRHNRTPLDVLKTPEYYFTLVPGWIVAGLGDEAVPLDAVGREHVAEIVPVHGKGKFVPCDNEANRQTALQILAA